MRGGVTTMISAMCVAAGCAASGERALVTSELPAETMADSDAGVHFHAEPFGNFTIGGSPAPGATERVLTPERGDADAGAPVLPRDDGTASAGELAWLVMHVADTPDRLRADDSDNARQLATRGADGVLAVTQVFRRGDAARLPFARRVLERNVVRVCRSHDPDAAQQLSTWLELGELGESDRTPGAGAVLWTRPADMAWPTDAVQRIEAWARAGLPCHPIENASPSPTQHSPTPVRGGTDAGSR